MSILEKAGESRSDHLVITIVGAPGTGKSTLGTTFPKPFMIKTLGESVPRDAPYQPVSLGITETSTHLWEQLTALINDPHEFETLIIDTVTGLEQMFIQEVIASDPKAKGINQALGGYGNGPSAVAGMHGRVRKAAEILQSKRKMHIVFLAHANIDRIDPPDSDGFNQYTLRLANKSMAPYVDNVDLVGFLKQATILRGDEGEAKKAVTTGEIVLTAYLT